MGDTSAAAPEVVVYGTVCLDRFFFADTNANAPPQEIPGGEAFNTATALAGWGIRVALTGTAIGADDEGERLRHLLDTSPLGLPRTYIPDVPEAMTPVCTVRVAADGERSMSGRGFASAVAPAPALLAPLLAARPLFVVDPNLGRPATEAALAAHSAGCPLLSMDFAPDSEVALLSRVWVASPEALGRLHGHDIAAEATGDPAALVRRIGESGARTAILTLGARGCVAWDREAGAVVVQPALVPPRRIVDTTGAGDTFRAGLCFGLQNGLALREMLRFAAAGAALHCCEVGAGSRVPLTEVLRLADVTL